MIIFAASFNAAAAVGAPLRTGDFSDAIGVNIHIEYTDGGYAAVDRVREALRYVGISVVRDAAPNPANQGQGGYEALARSGIHFDFFINGGPIGPAVGRLADLERRVPGSVHSVEGPNEINNHATFSFGGEIDRHRAATAYQGALYEAIKRERVLARVPVYAFTDYPNSPGRSDLGNFHSYPKGSNAPEMQLERDRKNARLTAPGEPLVNTEVGYSTAADGGVTEQAQASLLLASLLDNAAFGVRETYIYQLLDAYSDPGGRDGEKHYGMFDVGFRPKPAADMLHRLAALLRDAGTASRTFALQPFQFRADGLPAGSRSVVLEKADGRILLAVWRATPVAGVPTAGTLVRIKLAKAREVITLYDLPAGRRVAAQRTNEIALMLGSNPLFLEFSPN